MRQSSDLSISYVSRHLCLLCWDIQYIFGGHTSTKNFSQGQNTTHLHTSRNTEISLNYHKNIMLNLHSFQIPQWFHIRKSLLSWKIPYKNGFYFCLHFAFKQTKWYKFQYSMSNLSPPDYNWNEEIKIFKQTCPLVVNMAHKKTIQYVVIRRQLKKCMILSSSFCLRLDGKDMQFSSIRKMSLLAAHVATHMVLSHNWTRAR